MAYEEGKKALKNESELLVKLQKVANEHSMSTEPDSTERIIANGWKGSFEQLSEFNDELVKKSDGDFKDELTSESNLLLRLRAEASKGPEGFSESWKADFEEDIDIIDRLLKG